MSFVNPRTNDEKIIDDFFAASTERVEEMVTRALGQGRRVGELAIVLERAFDGRCMALCETRRQIAARFAHHEQMGEAERAVLVSRIETAAVDELPVILIVHQGEGLIAIGIRRATGSLVTVS